MELLIDTSIWTDAFHPKTSPQVKALAGKWINDRNSVLCEPVYVEYFRGVAEKHLPKMERYLSTIPMLPTPATLWKDVLPMLRACFKAGKSIGLTDALIGAIALCLCLDRPCAGWGIFRYSAVKVEPCIDGDGYAGHGSHPTRRQIIPAVSVVTDWIDHLANPSKNASQRKQLMQIGLSYFKLRDLPPEDQLRARS